MLTYEVSCADVHGIIYINTDLWLGFWRPACTCTKKFAAQVLPNNLT